MTQAANSSPPNGRIGISQSEINLFERCRRQWLTEYYWGFLEAEPSPLGARNFGTRIHLALEGHFGYGVDPLVILDLIYGQEVADHPADAKALNADLEMSKIMIAGLVGTREEQGWLAAEGHTSTFRVVGTEAEVAVPLPGFDGVDLRAKLDQIGQHLDTGLYSFLDWKTGDKFNVAEVVRQDPQMRFYSLVQWLAAGYPPPQPGMGLPDMAGLPPLVLGGIVTTLRKVKRSGQSKPPYYQWDPFRHTPEIMASTLLRVQSAVADMLSVRQALDAAYASGGQMEQIDLIQRTMARPTWITHDCSWRCPLAKGACGMMDDGSDWVGHFVRSGKYVQGDPYERYGRGSIAALVAAAG